MSRPARISQLRVIGLFLICCCSVHAQWDKKPSTEWSDQDAQKVLNDSPWVRRQQILTSLNKSKSTVGFNNGANGVDPSAPAPERITDSSYTTFYVRLLSAKPMRDALKRTKLMDQRDEPLAQKLTALVNFGPGEYIVIGVGQKTVHEGARQYEIRLLPNRTSAEIAKETFLEVNGDQRLPLFAYYGGGPHDISLGTLFIFKRFTDGKPVIFGDSGEVRFHTRFPAAFQERPSDRRFITLDASYRLKNMQYEGNLEF